MGSCSGSSRTAVPIVTRFVRAATAAAMGSTEGRYSSSMKWCSVSQTVSKPSSSTASMCSRVSAYRSARWIPDDGGLRRSYSTPNSTALSFLSRRRAGPLPAILAHRRRDGGPTEQDAVEDDELRDPHHRERAQVGGHHGEGGRGPAPPARGVGDDVHGRGGQRQAPP